ncbi:hypothetical protein SF23_11485, partial [Streptomyces sp. MBRL 10]
MDASHTHRHPVFCTVVPPHLLDRAALSEDTRRADLAQRTLERDSLLRTRRRSPPSAASCPRSPP